MVEPLGIKELELLKGTTCTGLAAVSGLDTRVSVMDVRRHTGWGYSQISHLGKLGDGGGHLP